MIYAPCSKSGQQKKGEEQKKGLLQAGLAMGALRFAATLLRPMVISYVDEEGSAGDGRRARHKRNW